MNSPFGPQSAEKLLVIITLIECILAHMEGGKMVVRQINIEWEQVIQVLMA